MECSATDINYSGNSRTSMQQYYTPLTAACRNKHLNTVKYLVQISSANVNLSDNEGDTPLTTACRKAAFAVSMFLLSSVSDLDVNLADIRRGNTALHFAIWCNENTNTKLHNACGEQGDLIEVMRLLCAVCNNINAQNNWGNTALHFACLYGHSDIVKALMLKGADETITNDLKETPALVAEKNGHKNRFDMLDRVSLFQLMNKNKLDKFVYISFIMVLIMQLLNRNY